MKNYGLRREASPRSRILGVVSVLDKRVQRAHYEHFLLKIAEAFDGYVLWVSTFVEVGFTTSKKRYARAW
jgi:hypothetical protein